MNSLKTIALETVDFEGEAASLSKVFSVISQKDRRHTGASWYSIGLQFGYSGLALACVLAFCGAIPWAPRALLRIALPSRPRT